MNFPENSLGGSDCPTWCAHDGNCPGAPTACANCGEPNPDAQASDNCPDCLDDPSRFEPDVWGDLQDTLGAAGADAYLRGLEG